VEEIIYEKKFLKSAKYYIQDHINFIIKEKYIAIFNVLINNVKYQNILDNYNKTFLPETQLASLNFKKIKINFFDISNTRAQDNELYNIKKPRPSGLRSFFIEVNEKKELIYIIDKFGKFYLVNRKILFTNISEINLRDVKEINTNLNAIKVLGTLVNKNKIYISYVTFDEKRNCNLLNVSVSELNEKYLKFKNFFHSSECAMEIYGGRMAYLNTPPVTSVKELIKNENSSFILLTTSSEVFSDKNLSKNINNNSAQDDNSIFGKILAINVKNKEYFIFSKGHRNSQGLVVYTPPPHNKKFDTIILETEHGPKGGDEINKIIYKKNYGWPISSYGSPYDKNIKNKYIDEHKNLEFEEPIFVFFQSIGISQIISLPNKFLDHWKNNFLISSLWDKSIYRIKFDESFEKVIYYEKIFIGERIRDLKYIEKENSIALALESVSASYIGILSVNTNSIK
jgi:hypothetical protein